MDTDFGLSQALKNLFLIILDENGGSGKSVISLAKHGGEWKYRVVSAGKARQLDKDSEGCFIEQEGFPLLVETPGDAHELQGKVLDVRGGSLELTDRAG